MVVAKDTKSKTKQHEVQFCSDSVMKSFLRNARLRPPPAPRCITPQYASHLPRYVAAPSPPLAGQVFARCRSGRYPPRSGGDKYALFMSLVRSQMEHIKKTSQAVFADSPDYQSLGIRSQNELDNEFHRFFKAVSRSLKQAVEQGIVDKEKNPLFWNLRNAFVRSDKTGLSLELRNSFYSFISSARFSKFKSVTAIHRQLADFRFPWEWFPATRTLQRTVHLHVGPTNSGKTYRALKALEAAKSGIYAGPLRLLAHEIYTRFQAKGKPCALVTGEEQRVPELDQYFSSCTVEMTPLNKLVDVAIIDEIQMIADDERGWAWTQAFLGVQAKELHVCGEERAVKLIQDLCGRIGDKCIVHRYQRLSPLQPSERSLQGDFKNLMKGDAVVTFSRVALHALKKGIEMDTGRRCAIVYGSLPPETRAQQAALFNNPDNDYDFIAASDAIGMGLNLEIKRVVFETTTKHDGTQFRPLAISELKQIGGRAGRYRTAAAESERQQGDDADGPAAETTPEVSRNPGYVTTMEEYDLKTIQESFTGDAPPLQTAGIKPPAFVLERFASYFPRATPLSFIILRLREFAQLSDLCHMCDLEEMIDVAKILQPFDMSIADKCIFLAAPTSLREPGFIDTFKAMARCVSDNTKGHLLDVRELDLDIIEAERGLNIPDGEYLRRLEALHKAITLYLWLSYRYSGVFQSQKLAFHVKGLVEEKIDAFLENLGYSPEIRRQRLRRRHRQVEKQQRVKQLYVGEEGANVQPPHREGPGNWEEEGHEEPLVEDEAELALVVEKETIPERSEQSGV